MIGLPNAEKPVFRAYRSRARLGRRVRFYSIKVQDGP